MVSKKKFCKSCGNECYIFSKGRCKTCSTKKDYKPIKKSYLSKTPTAKALIKKEEKKEYTKEQFRLFKIFYDEHETKRCEQCACKINECLSINVHHLLPKSIEKYKKIALNSKFWMLLCGNCHSRFENSGLGDMICKRTAQSKLLFEHYEEVKELLKD